MKSEVKNLIPKLANRFNRVRSFSNSGTRDVPVFVRRLDERKRPVMEIKEMRHFYDEIQTYKDDNNIYKILAQFNNDISKVDFNKGIYVDMTKLPKSYNDMYNNLQALREDYDILPQDFKRLIGNNAELYIGLTLSGNLDKVVDAYKAKDFAKVKDIVNSPDMSNVGDKVDKANIVNNSKSNIRDNVDNASSVNNSNTNGGES